MNLSFDKVLGIMIYKYSKDALYEMCYDAHKDQYGTKGRNLFHYTKMELINWWISHYQWNEPKQMWESMVPFDNTEYHVEPESEELYEVIKEMENEYEYYSQFG